MSLLVLFACGWLVQNSNGFLFTNDTVPGFQRWIPENTTRGYMYCPDEFLSTERNTRRRCPCHARPCWDFTPSACGKDVEVQALFVEYVSFGKADIMEASNGINQNLNTYHSLRHNLGRLTEIPSNICLWNDSLIILDLSDNLITDIRLLKCMRKLDTIILDNNRISKVPNDTFEDMEYLRVFTIKNNLLISLDTNALSISSGNIFVVDLSNNDMRTADISDVFRKGQFCNFSCINCDLSEITNKRNFTAHEDTIVGPGDMEFHNTNFDFVFDEVALNNIGLRDYIEWPRLFRDGGRLRIDSSSVSCDCNIYGFLNDLGRDAHVYWPNLMEDSGATYICESPQRLAGTNLTDLYLRGDYSDLVCDMVDCPYPCRCQDRPYDGHVIVNCSGSGLERFPSHLPTGVWGNSDVVLLLNDNSLTSFEQKDYMSRVLKLNISGNSITDFPSTLALNKRIELDLSGEVNNPLRLPPTFYEISPLFISFGNNTVICDCDNIWIRDWVVIYRAFQTIRCSTPFGEHYAEDISETLLDCLESDNTKSVIVAVILSVVVVLIIVIYVCLRLFRYELYLLRREFWDINRNVPKRFDVMLSFADTNHEVNSYVNSYLSPALRQAGYSVFTRFFNILPGDNKSPEELLARSADESRNYVVILCPDYLKDETTVEEFGIMWNRFCSNNESKLIVINFSTIDKSEINDRRIKAFLRLKLDLNYKIRYGTLFGRLKHKLGPPKGAQTTESKRGNAIGEADSVLSSDINISKLNDTNLKVSVQHPNETDLQHLPQTFESRSDQHDNRHGSKGCMRCHRPETETTDTRWLRERFQRHVQNSQKYKTSTKS